MDAIRYEYLDDRYQNLSVLGNAEKKSTYLAKDTVTGEVVVKKYIQPENVAIYSKLQEIDNPHLAKVLRVEKGYDKAFVILEYISGKTIENLLKEQSVFSEDAAIKYVEQLLQGLVAIHKRGIIHRDINPGNVLVSTDGVVKILDFDIGRQYKESQTSDTTILGTVGYAALEQFGFTQSDVRTDIYAVGVLMNVMLTGKMSGQQLCSNEWLGDIIKTCTHIDPGKRFQDVEQILEKIIDLKHGNERVCNGLRLKMIPGFRSGETWKKLVAGSYYAMMVIYSIDSLISCAKTVQAFILESIAIVMYLWLAVFIPLNFGNWMKKVPLIREFGRVGRIALGVILWIVLFYYGIRLDNYVRIDLLHIAVKQT